MTALWQTIAACLPATAAERDQAAALLADYRAHGYIARPPAEMARLSHAAIAAFYAALPDGPRPVSSSSAWMLDASFCFINVRATGVDGRHGTFIHAAKLLPALRADAIHLGPFTDYDFGVIYAPRSSRTISPLIIEPELPLAPLMQAVAFVEACHALGKAVGFDLLPHVAQFALTVMVHPEAFRWLKLNAAKDGLAGGMSQADMLAEPAQAAIVDEIRARVTEAKRASGIETFASPEDDHTTVLYKREVYFRLIGTLIAAGYWSIPSQSWNAHGVPAFAGYNYDGGYPRFDYRSPDGADQSGAAYHVVTPFKTAQITAINRAPESAPPHPPGIDLFADTFTYWREQGFDFVRYDSVDHIFDSADGPWPLSDRPAPDVLREVIARTRRDAPHIGALAERMVNDFEGYPALGFDLGLGSDPLRPLDRALVESGFRLYDWLDAHHKQGDRPFGVTFAVDTHDSGNPAFWGQPLVQAAGAEGMRRRHFLARFLDIGRAPRPKYECIGSQDLSYGLYAANISDVNLTWVGDTDYTHRYHLLEDLYARHRALLRRGRLLRRHADDDGAWWVAGDGSAVLVAALNYAAGRPARMYADLSGVGAAPNGLIYNLEHPEPAELGYDGYGFDFNLDGLRLVVLGVQR